MAAVSLFCNTNMAAVTSRENAVYPTDKKIERTVSPILTKFGHKKMTNKLSEI